METTFIPGAGFLGGLLIGLGSAGLLLANGKIAGNRLLLIAGGLLVGVGTQLGSGCTSGHGVSGMARASRRSFVATLTFMAAGAVTVFVARHRPLRGRPGAWRRRYRFSARARRTAVAEPTT